MKKIIGNKLYDTEKAEKIYSFNIKRKTFKIGNTQFFKWYDVDVYKTKKENYFIYGYSDDTTTQPFIEETTLEEIKKIIKIIDPDKYIEMGFNDFEEA